MDILKDRRAIVTGAASGIGEAIATQFGREGASVALADINYELAQEVSTHIKNQGKEAVAVDVDVSDEKSVDRMVKKVLEEFGGIDILVNNAGIYPRYVWYDMTPEQWDRIQAVNLKGHFLCSRAAFPHLKQNNAGKIINISSVTYWLGQPRNLVHYIASKGGVIGFTRALAHELGEFNIQVNAITPGAVETEEEKKVATAEMVTAIVANQCLRRRVLPRDIARTAVFLASSDADMITGQTINVDGGWAMH